MSSKCAFCMLLRYKKSCQYYSKWYWKYGCWRHSERVNYLKSKVNPEHGWASIRRNSIFRRICRFSGSISFARISIGCLSKQRERIHSSLSFHYEHRLWAGSRTGQEGKLLDHPLSWREKSNGIVVCLWHSEGETQSVYGHACHQHIVDNVAYIRSSQSDVQDFQVPVLNLSCLQVCGESGATVFTFFYFKFISNQTQQPILSSRSKPCGFISQKIVSTLLKWQTDSML